MKINKFSLLFLHRKAAQTASYLHVSDEWGGPKFPWVHWKFRDDSMDQTLWLDVVLVCDKSWKKGHPWTNRNFFVAVIVFFFAEPMCRRSSPPKNRGAVFLCLWQSGTWAIWRSTCRSSARRGFGANLSGINSGSVSSGQQSHGTTQVRRIWLPQTPPIFCGFKKKWYIYIYINLCTLPSATPSILWGF